MKNISRILLVIVILFLPINMVPATEVHGAETQGKVGFMGEQEHIGAPNPKPPKVDTIKPIGMLPQTNYINSPLLTMVGILLVVCGVFIIWKKNKNTIIKKEGIDI